MASGEDKNINEEMVRMGYIIIRARIFMIWHVFLRWRRPGILGRFVQIVTF